MDSENQKRVLFKSRFAKAVLFYVLNEYEMDILSLDYAHQKIAFKILKDMKGKGDNIPNIAHEIAYKTPF